MEFKATQMSIEDALRLKRKYTIPRFQREYSWESEELTTIWDDLLDNLIYRNHILYPQEYFLGSLVLVGDDDDSINIDRFIVDGQQRLMTFTIAFSVLTQNFIKLGEDRLSKATFSNIMAEDNDGNEYSKLVAQTPKPFFQYRIQSFKPDFTKIPQNPEEKRILFAYQFFEKRLEKSSLMSELESRYTGINKSISYPNALKAFRDQILVCKVVYVTVKSFEDAYTIFEVLNAKGKNLTALDIIKNSIFSILTRSEPIDFAADKWKAIRTNIAATDEDLMTFYRHFWLSNYNFTTSKKLVKDFQNSVDRNISSYTAFINKLEAESLLYRKLSKPIEDDWSQPEDLPVFISLDALSTFNTSQVRTFLLALFDVKSQGKISQKNFIKVITFLEHFHFIFTSVCSSRASGLERRYSSYSRKLRKCADKKETASCINELMGALNETIPTYSVFESKIFDVQFTSEKTKSKKLVQYILKKLETYFAGSMELRPQSFTIEHIIPESTKASFVGMLGNLLPLGEQLNGELKNKDFMKKMSRYPESSYSTVKQFVEQYSGQSKFLEEDVISRTRFLADILYNKF